MGRREDEEGAHSRELKQFHARSSELKEKHAFSAVHTRLSRFLVSHVVPGSVDVQTVLD